MENKERIKQELLPLVKLSGMSGANNRYIKSSELTKESLSLVGVLPKLNNKDEYFSYLDNLALVNNFYKELANKYNMTEEQARDRFLSATNLFNLL